MVLYQCDCGFGSTNGASGDSITRHLHGQHDYEVNATSSGYYCNACTKGWYGSGRRFDSFEELLIHLEDRHSCDYISPSECKDPNDPVYYQCDCGFGSSTGGSEESFVRHIKGTHFIDANVSSSGVFYCNDCSSRSGYGGKRFHTFQGLMQHLEENHGFDGYREFEEL